MRFGKPLHRYESVDSTQEVARGLVLTGEAAGAVVSAEYQTKGRGRLGRPWFAPPGANVCMTVIAPAVAVEDAWKIALIAGVSVAEGVMLATDARPRVRFPNDVYLNGAKLSGVLVETVATKERGIVVPLVGIGVNVNVAPENFPEDLQGQATSLLATTGKLHAVDVVRTAILGRLDANWPRLHGQEFADALLPRWRELSDPTAYRTFVIEGSPVPCRVLRVGPDGGVTLETESGTRQTISGQQALLG
jgi:BirA family transcriptional regulator, biotin operon repressor / biotin---[acetyl-CoA-carboxylase] ligase